MDKPRRFHSLLWPILLIAVGVIWLLNALGYLPAANIETLLSMWPLLLIFIGLDIIFGRRSAAARVIIAVVMVILVVAILFAAPVLRLPNTIVRLPTITDMQSKQIIEPLGSATSAVVDLQLTSFTTKIHPLIGTDNLMVANIDYYGTLNYSATGDPIKQINLSMRSEGNPFNVSPMRDIGWDIGLSQAVPFDLSIDGGSGSANIDLTGVQLSSFTFDQRSGSFVVKLPASTDGYAVSAVGGSGSLNLNLPEQANLTMHLTGHSGSIHIVAPLSAALHIEIQNAGSGSVSLPAHIQTLNSSGNKEGVWQTYGYDGAYYKQVIIIDELGSGSLSFR